MEQHRPRMAWSANPVSGCSLDLTTVLGHPASGEVSQAASLSASFLVLGCLAARVHFQLC